MSIQRLHCNRCGKSVSTWFIPMPTETPDKGLIVRAWIECPECIAKSYQPVLIEQVEPGDVDARD